MTVVVYPAQCECGHIYQEKYQLPEPNEKGEVGFCWCGWCRTKRMVKPIDFQEDAEQENAVKS